MSHTNKVKDTINGLKKKFQDSPWKKVLYQILETEDFETAIYQLISDVEAKQMFTPFLKNIFRNLELCDPKAINTIFITAYPFNEKGLADGLAFSTKSSSLEGVNGKKLLKFQRSFPPITDGQRENESLDYLVKQGVMLWNVSLTAPIGENNTENPINKNADHYQMWKPITEMFLKVLSKHLKGIVFVFVGSPANELNNSIAEGNFKMFLPEIKQTEDWNNIDCFNGINEILIKNKKHPIVW